MILVDPDTRVASANPLGSQVLEGNLWDQPGPLRERGLPDRIRQPLEAALRGDAPSHCGSDLSRAADIRIGERPRKVLVTAAPIPHFDGGKPGAVIVLDDVTDLARLDELRGELVAIASHELKTPLTTLRMNLLLLREQDLDLSPRQQEMLGSAIAGTDELAATIEEMLDLTRIESGQLTLNPESLDLNPLIGESLRSLRPRFEDRGLSVRVEAAAGPLAVRVDPVRIKLVLANLLGNAVKYSPRGGAITIGVRAVPGREPSETGQVELAVTDEGPGIPQELRERVFEKFFRVEQVRPDANRGVRGTGIGLFLCRQIIEAHGGRIWCEDGPNGRGLRVAFSLLVASPSHMGCDEE